MRQKASTTSESKKRTACQTVFGHTLTPSLANSEKLPVGKEDAVPAIHQFAYRTFTQPTANPWDLARNLGNGHGGVNVLAQGSADPAWIRAAAWFSKLVNMTYADCFQQLVPITGQPGTAPDDALPRHRVLPAQRAVACLAGWI